MTAKHQLPDDRLRTFEPYDIDNGRTLIKETVSHLEDLGFTTFQPTPTFSRALGKAFRRAFIEAAAVPIVPDAVDIAVREAVSRTIHQFLDHKLQSLETIAVPYLFARVTEEFALALELGYDGSAAVIAHSSEDDDNGAPFLR